MDGKAKDEFFKRGYGLEMEDKQKGTRMRAYFPEELRAFEQDYNNNRIVIGCSVCGRDFVIKKNAKGKTTEVLSRLQREAQEVGIQEIL